jgi:uncharacterized protein (DUF305 family)
MERVLTLLVIPAAAVSLAACGVNAQSEPASVHPVMTGTTPTASTTGDHNDQDVIFAQQMIPHHQQAIEMADLAASRATTPEVKQLATKIKSSQEAEIKEMARWLQSWRAAATPGGETHTGHGPGMMSPQDMKKLEGLSGAQFDKTFLTMMIKHHKGAVEMAKTELAKGKSGAAKALAGKIVASQTAQIITMTALLKKM